MKDEQDSYEVLDRAIAATTEASKGGTRYITIPKDIALAMDLGDKCELRLVKYEDDSKAIILTKFYP